MAVQTQIQTRRGTAASWTSTNPTLAAGEIGFETDTGKFKIGNGSTAWAALAYSAGATAVTYLFNATSGQTTFSGADANGLTLAYTVGAEQVYLNGVLQVRGSDYTATNGTSIVLTSGALTSDVLNVIAYSAMTITDTYTQAQADAKFVQVANTPNPSNPVLNSAMQVWQKGTSVAVSGANYVYTADRWQLNSSSNDCTVSRQATNDTTNLPFIQYCARVQRNSGQTGGGNLWFYQPFETINSIAFTGKTVTMSFYARKGANFSGTSDVLNFRLYTGTGTDQNFRSAGYTGSANPIDATATLTTTWQRFSATATIATTTTEITPAIYYTPTGTAGANDYFEVTGVQLEVGSVATPFRTYSGTIAGELAACQRYYWRNSGVAAYASYGAGYGASSTITEYIIASPVTMRVAPTSVDYASLGASVYGAGPVAISSLSLSAVETTQNSMVVLGTHASGITTGKPYFIANNNNTAGYLGFSAEL